MASTFASEKSAPTPDSPDEPNDGTSAVDPKDPVLPGPDGSEDSGTEESATASGSSEDSGATLDVPALTRLLDGRYAEVRNLVRKNLVEQASILDDQITMRPEEFRDRVLEMVQWMAGTGATGLGFPTEYGGGGDIGASIAAFETLAFGDLSVLVKTGVQFGLFGGAILQLGTERHHDAYLEDLINADLLGCFAMTESGHGSNVQHLGTLATYDLETREFVITTTTESARKDYIGNAAKHGTVAVVFAKLEVGGNDEGVHAFVVPIRDADGNDLPGVTTGDDGAKMGLAGVDNGRLWFDGVRVPRENLLNRYADVTASGVYESEIENPNRRFFTMLGTLVQGRVSVGGAGINASKVAITIAVKYALKRRQFGDPGTEEEELLLDYGLHQRRLIPLVAATYAMHFAQETLVGQLHEVLSAQDPQPGDDERERRALESRAAGTKAYGTWHATRTIQEAREACGGAGYLAANRFAALKADTDVFTTFEGDNHVLLQLVAKGLLTDFSTSFEDLDQFGVARFVADLAVETVVERTAVHKILERFRDVIPGGDDVEDGGLQDPDYHLTMLRWREEHVLSGVARRLKRGIDSKMAPTEVFSRCQTHVIHAARAHMERLILEDFVTKVADLPQGDLRTALEQLCALHALVLIEADRAWFMEHGRLSSQRSKAITREVEMLCRVLRPLAEDLVDGFGVPPEMLHAELLAHGY